MDSAGELTTRRRVGLISEAPSGSLAHIAGWRLCLIRPTAYPVISPITSAFIAQFSTYCSELSIIVRSCREGIPYEANSYAGAILCRPDDEAGSGALFDAVGISAGGAGDSGADGGHHGVAWSGRKY
ncbi:hypothetical protein CKO_04615 [Citrobacter koseri ATCC BAA-895]|uniref:Uncharacterized protein n=1 Tax=Citrobacter koseri (strain ATCC BAA-895 / CDC 4225-83 / SGSC4696) TaxID=290338 RepID=A8AQA2_CITK8|nr:hypothetical protein CKO_04615 [Citrobacter koseri ATCC BAA-895]